VVARDHKGAADAGEMRFSVFFLCHFISA
jgi:hypothetical protein